MKELIQRLSEIADSYDDFILGVINYAKKNPAHIEILNNYMKKEKGLTSSDVVAFIMQQKDFHNYSAVNNKMQKAI